jgi:hypothetical protein
MESHPPPAGATVVPISRALSLSIEGTVYEAFALAVVADEVHYLAAPERNQPGPPVWLLQKAISQGFVD